MASSIQAPLSFGKARRTAASAWLEKTNPLAGLSIRAAQRIYDAARGGDYSRIQYIYSEIEQEDPVLMTCVDRRASALSGLGWKVSTQRDGAEADEQKAALEERLAGAEGLDEALEHLALAFFRGYAHARPVWDGPGKLAGFDLLNGWNFARDPATGTWFWNERAEYCDPSHPGPGLVPVPPGELVTVQRARAIDRPALACALRDAVGERDWGRFLERYGIPFVVFTAPPTASEEKMPRFAEAAEKIADGLSTAVPAGSTVSFAGEARGADPFTPFVEQIHKLIVLMSTGGTLTSLAESGAGTLAGNAQMEVWEQIVKRDSVAIGAALDRGVCRPLLRGIRDFAGRAPLVKFELGGDRQLDPGEIFDVAAKARQAGYRISKDELERATGYTLEEDPSAGAGTPGTGLPGGGGFALNRKTPLQFGCDPLQNARSAPDGKSTVPEAGGALARVLEAFRSDLGPAAEELQKVLDLPEDEMRTACKDLAGRLQDLLPADPAMAAILAEELAGAFAEAVGETISVDAHADKPAAGPGSGPGAAAGEAAIANEEGECRAKDPATCPVHGTPRSRRGWDQEQVASGKRKVGSLIEDLGKRGPDGKSKAWKNHDEELGALNAQVAADIKKANPNMKADAGTMQTVDVDQLNHAMLEHGEGHEKWPTSVGITHDDLKRIPEVLSDYDEIVPGRGKAEGKKQEAVIFKKRYPDGTVCCVEIDSFVRADNRRVLKFQTMWKDKN